jgi:hypothetical protein
MKQIFVPEIKNPVLKYLCKKYDCLWIDGFQGEKMIDNNERQVQILHMRGVPRRELERYLQKKAHQVSENIFSGPGWQVALSEERSESLGKFSLVAVDVTLEVEKDQFEDFLITFRKNFLRGGG